MEGASLCRRVNCWDTLSCTARTSFCRLRRAAKTKPPGLRNYDAAKYEVERQTKIGSFTKLRIVAVYEVK